MARMISRRSVFSIGAGSALAAHPASAALLRTAPDTVGSGEELVHRIAGGKSRGQVILLRGFANIFSLGMDALRKELEAQGITAEVRGSGSATYLAKKLETQYRASSSNRPIILVGHSNGADLAMKVGAELEKTGIPVALMITFDPTINGPVTKNVRRAINFHTTERGMWAPVTAVAGYRGRLINKNVSKEGPTAGHVNHFNIDKNKTLHAEAIKEIKRALR